MYNQHKQTKSLRYFIKQKTSNQRWAGYFQYFFKQRTPAEILVFGFASIIVIGTLLLSLPIATRTGEYPGFINTLFTSASAVCVTGLVVVDTGTFWSLFGQIVIMILIQIGGLGFMTLMTIIFVISGRRITIKDRMVLQSSVNSKHVQGVVKFTKYIIIVSLMIEAIGAILYATVFIPEFGVAKGAYYAIFHSISSFCNAGFDLMGNFQSFTAYIHNPIINFTSCALIIVGGLGFAVTSDIYNFHSTHRLNIHSKMVLTATFFLISAGTVAFLILEYNNPATLQSLSLPNKLMTAFYQSVTTRTAGSNTISQFDLTRTSKLVTIILMFIGASPGSTGGGVKTTTFAVLLLSLKRVFTGEKDINIYGRRISTETIQRAFAIVLTALILNSIIIVLLTLLEPNIPGLSLVFEVYSAYSTVGLSCNVTTQLGSISKLLIIFNMFTGRVGPLTIAYVITRREHGNNQQGNYKLPKGNILLG